MHLRRALTPDLAPALRNAAAQQGVAAIGGAVAHSPRDHFAWYHLAVAEALLARGRLGVQIWDALAADSRDLVLTELAQATLACRR